MHSNSSFWGETVFLVHFIEFSTRSCCLYYFNVTESKIQKGEPVMEINIVFQIAAVGILVAVLNQVLVRAGREEQAMMTTLAGLVVVLFWVIQYISQLFDTVQTLFQI